MRSSALWMQSKSLRPPWCRITLTALGIRLDGDKVTAMVDPVVALLQIGLPEGPQLQPKPHRKWHRGADPSPPASC